jgi:hypothetical protein
MARTSKTTMTDALGRTIPTKYVPHYDRENDTLVRRIYARHLKARKMLEEVMLEDLKDFDAIRALRREEKMSVEGLKGNLSSRSFDGTVEVRIVCRHDIAPDDRLNAARAKMEAWVRSQVEGASKKMADVVLPLIQEAFRPSTTGGLSMYRVASLLRIQISDPVWQEARQLMIDSLGCRVGRNSIQVVERSPGSGKMKYLTLDINDCWPEGKRHRH